MHIRVSELRPGMRIHRAGQSATFIASAPHPRYPPLSLVIWKLDDGSWSLDALDYQQDVGLYDYDTTPTERWERVQEAFGV